MITDRRDLRPMAMAARDVRPGMVVVEGNSHHTATIVHQERTWSYIYNPAGYWLHLHADHTLQILGEEVRGSEIAAGDVVSVGKRWHAADGSPHTFSPTDGYVRAYFDPAWELAQAQQ